MMNLTGNDKQFGPGGQRQWTFRYRIVLEEGKFDAVRAIVEASQFATPAFLAAPEQPPALPGLAALEIDFSGGPVLAFKVAEDNRRLIVRFWNVTDKPVGGSLRLADGWAGAERCDALERAIGSLDVVDRRVQFEAEPWGIATVAIWKK